MKKIYQMEVTCRNELYALCGVPVVL